MINFDFKKACYSCAACGDSCPVNAISYDENLHPVVDAGKCIDCSLCEKVCVALREPKDTAYIDAAAGYIAKNKDDAVRQNSSSGGVFIRLAEEVIAAGGYVCGCIYDENLMPKHVLTNDFAVCKKMMGSKYVKSDVSVCISQIKKLAKDGNTVLFAGVPCQIAAVKNCVDSEKLLTLAVVCHGSIERGVWAKYLDEQSENGEIVAVTMRDKSRGYLNYGLKFTYADGTEHITYRSENGYFLKSFTDGLLERDRCLSCRYKGAYIKSDILLGDAWGMDKIYPEFTDNMGCSAVLALTAKGKELFEGVKESFNVQSVDSDVLIKNNGRISTPAPKNPFLDSFRKKEKTANLHNLTERYAKSTILNRIKYKIAKLLKI